MTTQKSYILGLLVGGGKIESSTFLIELPFKKWGEDPKRMAKIAGDILGRIRGYFKSAYGIDVNFEILANKWVIKPLAAASITQIKSDLIDSGLPSTGFLLKSADLRIAKTKLTGVFAESFLSGIFDARASLTKSHRRFFDNAPIVSIEIPGSTENFAFVRQLSSWLTELGSVTDQILYNHPNQHSSNDPTYAGWKKGFKIRFLIRSFLAHHSFALHAKSIEANRIELTQEIDDQSRCINRKIRKPNPIVIHTAQGKASGNPIYNQIFLHYFHVCDYLGCPFAPKAEVAKLVKKANSLISFFPILVKGETSDLTAQFRKLNTDYYSATLSSKRMKVESMTSDNALKGRYAIRKGLAFLFSPGLKGKRHIGSQEQIIRDARSKVINMTYINISDLEPILVSNPENGRSFICSSISSKLNQKMIKKNLVIYGNSIRYSRT